MQKYGSEFTSTDVEFKNGVFSFDMAGAYGDENVKSIKREFSFTDTVITLHDSFDYTGDAPITERLVTRIRPEIQDGYVAVGELKVFFDNDICTVSIKESKTSRSTELYFIDFELKENVREITLKFE